MQAAEGVAAEGRAAGTTGQNAHTAAAHLTGPKSTSGKKPPIDKVAARRHLEALHKACMRYYKKHGGLLYCAESGKDVEYEVVAVPVFYCYDPEKKRHFYKNAY